MTLNFQRIAILACFAAVASTDAAPRFAVVFGDHAVLQRDAEIRIWGSGANPEAQLQLRFGELEAVATADAEGNWEASLPPLTADAEGEKLEIFEDGTVVADLDDVVVGEVWLAAGQSNMQFRSRNMLKALPELQSWADSADVPKIRFRRIDDPVLPDPKEEARDLANSASWSPMTPETVLDFSAVAAVFARELEAKLKVPIGIIDVSWGGKPIEPFIPRDQFKSPLLTKIRDLADGEKLDELAKLRGGVIIRNPEGHPGAIFNARIAPLIPYGLRGFIWYQAESNAGRGEDPREYREKMVALVTGWRTRWNNDDLPFYYVQLPGYPPATGWIRMREEQRRALTIPKTGMAVTIDIRGEGIHPPDKIAVGDRLARLALSKTYGVAEVISSGPTYLDHLIAGPEVQVRFSGAEGGLMIGNKPRSGKNPPVETPDAPLSWFELSGVDGVWHPAEAKIDGNHVIVTSDSVSSPVAVRYACNTAPQGGNLYNRAGLPASPFCSDLKMLPWVDQPPK